MRRRTVLTQVPNEGFERAPSSLSRYVSIGTHVLAFGLLLLGGRHAWKVRPVSMRGGSRATLLYWQGGVGTGTARTHTSGKVAMSAAKKIERTDPVQRRKQPALAQPHTQKDGELQASSAGGAPSKSQMTGSGTGTQDATPAFPTYSPNPPVSDRSLLPQSETNVVVDVNVSAQGEVMDEKMVHGLGNGIDQIILDTVRSWRFHPATLDGNPVASVSELVFPMSQRYRG